MHILRAAAQVRVGHFMATADVLFENFSINFFFDELR
jgi:hypothetical protein